MNELALFAGAGGSILAGKLLGWHCICAVEKEPYCREVLLRRQRDRMLPVFPIWDDVQTFDGRKWRGVVDILTAGFPCQPFSLAGKQRAEKNARNMWPDTIRIIREVGSSLLLLENVPGLAAKPYFWEQILPDLAEAGYDAQWRIVSAAECGAPHLRKRLWITATNTERAELWDESGRRGRAQGEGLAKSSDDGRWKSQPDVGRVADGVAHRMDRLRALGNGWVPEVARTAWNER